MTTATYSLEDLRDDSQLSAFELRRKYADHKGTWDDEGEHPRFAKWDWYQTVAQRSTLLGYWEWLPEAIEKAYDREI